MKHDNPGNSQVKKIIMDEIANVNFDSSLVKRDGCVACHLLSTLAQRSDLSEPDASEYFSQALSEDPKLSEEFISLVEKVHLKERMMGVTFAMKSRDAKDRYIASNIKSTIDELSRDLVDRGAGAVTRKLFTAFAALQIAQNLGIDYHASAEELYYYMRKDQNNAQRLIDSFAESICHGDKRNG